MRRGLRLVGEFVLVNPRTGKVVRVEGLITRNFAKVIEKMLQPRQSYGSNQMISANLVDVGGNSFSAWIGGNASIMASSQYASFLLGSAKFGSVTSVTLGLFFKVGKGSLSLSPDNYELADPVQEIQASETTRQDEADKTIIIVTGSGTANTNFNCTEVGAYLRVLEGGLKDSRVTRDILIDHATVAGLSYSVGDPISIQYKLTLA